MGLASVSNFPKSFCGYAVACFSSVHPDARRSFAQEHFRASPEAGRLHKRVSYDAQPFPPHSVTRKKQPGMDTREWTR